MKPRAACWKCRGTKWDGVKTKFNCFFFQSLFCCEPASKNVFLASRLLGWLFSRCHMSQTACLREHSASPSDQVYIHNTVTHRYLESYSRSRATQHVELSQTHGSCLQRRVGSSEHTLRPHTAIVSSRELYVASVMNITKTCTCL